MITYNDFKLEGAGRNPSKWRVFLSKREIATVVENDLARPKNYLLQFKGQSQPKLCSDFNEVVHWLIASVNN